MNTQHYETTRELGYLKARRVEVEADLKVSQIRNEAQLEALNLQIAALESLTVVGTGTASVNKKTASTLPATSASKGSTTKKAAPVVEPEEADEELEASDETVVDDSDEYAQDEADEEPQISDDDVRSAMTALTKKIGGEAARKFLDKTGGKEKVKIAALTQEQRALVLKKAGIKL